MRLIFGLSWRNLFRQKRRNILLGSGIAFGMMILTITNAFSGGIVDVLMNDVVADYFGHLVVGGIQGNRMMINDRRYIEHLIRETIPSQDLVSITENPVLIGRAVGNGEVDDVVVWGEAMRSKKEKKAFFDNSFTLLDGDYENYFSKNIDYPVIISAEKAQSLNVKVNDVIRLRLPMVTGQIQAVQLTVVAIVKANSEFKTMKIVMDSGLLKRLLGYQAWQSPKIKVMLKNPQRTAELYERLLRRKLHSGKIAFPGKVNQIRCQIMAFKGSRQANGISWNRYIRILDGKAFGADGVMISKNLARQLKLRCNDPFIFEYQTKFRGAHREKFKISAIYESRFPMDDQVLLIGDELIFPIYNEFLPQSMTPIGVNNPFYRNLADEWKLYEPSKDSEALQKKYNADRATKTSQARLDVSTMYQGASQLLKVENAFKIITGVAFLVIFFVIQIGVVNTLRITIKERTREIGTVRAIGMQKNEVGTIFIMETLMLTAISCVAGIGLGMIGMWFLGKISWNANVVISMILKGKHLFFKVNPLEVLTHFGLIMVISGVTAYFPARHAVKLSAVKALQHYE